MAKGSAQAKLNIRCALLNDALHDIGARQRFFIAAYRDFSKDSWRWEIR